MSALIEIAIHPSQFPGQILAELRNSLRRRQINHKFLYDSWKQTEQWLQLHQALSPSCTDPHCAGCYDSAFAAAARRIGTTATHLVGLGCGGGQKDARLLGWLKESSLRVSYTPVDVSTAMVSVACQALAGAAQCFPGLVCDLASSDDIAAVFDRQTPAGTIRLATFFGMMPNFEPASILPRLAGLLRSGDLLLLSANLAPGKDYGAGLRQILPLYDNSLTNEWLMTFLLQLGVEKTDGQLEWHIEPGPSGQDLLRVAACFHFERARQLSIQGEQFGFVAGDQIRVFFSYRYTPERLHTQLSRHGICVLEEWITPSGEEGVLLCRRDGEAGERATQGR